mgnify:CR=1 FL=1
MWRVYIKLTCKCVKILHRYMLKTHFFSKIYTVNVWKFDAMYLHYLTSPWVTVRVFGVNSKTSSFLNECYESGHTKKIKWHNDSFRKALKRTYEYISTHAQTIIWGVRMRIKSITHTFQLDNNIHIKHTVNKCSHLLTYIIHSPVNKNYAHPVFVLRLLAMRTVRECL